MKTLCAALVMRRFVPVAAIILCSTLPSWAQSSIQVQRRLTDDSKPLSSQEVPAHGTFWSLQRTNHPPLPFNQHAELGLPVYYLGYGNAFLVDDRSVDYAALAAEHATKTALRKLELASGLREADELDAMEEEGGGMMFMAYDYPASNALWLEITQVTNQYAYLTLHGTVDTSWYQLLSVTNLTPPRAWQLGEVRVGASGTNQTVFDPVFVGDELNRFFRAHQANGSVSVVGGPVAYEPTAAMPGTASEFSIYSSFAYDVTVYYQLSGTAQNGVDYTNLTGVLTVPAYQSGIVEIRPKPDAVVEVTETVILTLIQTNDYLIWPTLYQAANVIKDTSTSVLIYTAQGSAVEPDGPPGQSALPVTVTVNRYDERNLFPPFTVRYALTGTASNGVDYVALAGEVTFGDQETTTNLVITPLNDSLAEGIETLTLTLVASNSYAIQSGYEAAAVTLADSTTTVSIQLVQNAIEPNPSGSATSQTGLARINRSDSRGALPTLTMAYQVSGLATMGVDFTNLTGSVTMPAGVSNALVYVQPLADNQLEGDESVTLSLVAGDSYVVNSNYASATVMILDNLATNTFVPVANLTGPVGIDYHAPSNSLIVSGNHDFGGEPLNFARIYTNTVSSNIVTVVTNWSGVHGVLDEVKLATVKAAVAGFTNGDLYFGNSNGIGWISADGTKSNLNWCILTNGVVTNALALRGGLYVDQSGVFSNQLIAVTSPAVGVSGSKGVWRVSAQGIPTLITNINTPHLEGVIALTNDAAKWGPWAGKILSGDETLVAAPPIYAISTNGTLTAFNTTTFSPGGIHTEDFDIIPQNQDLYACDYSSSTIVKLSRNYLTNYIGDVLITDEISSPPKLVIVHWDAATTNFIARSIPFRHANGSSGSFEHVTFAPIDLPPLTP